MVLAALKRLDETAAEPLPVHEPALRGIAGVVDGIPMGGQDEDDRPADDRPVAGDPPVARTGKTGRGVIRPVAGARRVPGPRARPSPRVMPGPPSRTPSCAKVSRWG